MAKRRKVSTPKRRKGSTSKRRSGSTAKRRSGGTAKRRSGSTPKPKGKRSPSTSRDIGFLLATSPTEWAEFIGWFEAAKKSDITVHYVPEDGASGDPALIKQAADDLVSSYKVIVTAGTAAAVALKKAIQGTDVQFIYASVGDPAGSGLSPYQGGPYTGGCNNQADATTVSQRVAVMLNKPTVFKDKFAVVGDYGTHKAAMDAVYDALIQGGKQVIPLTESSLPPESDIVKFINDPNTNNGLKQKGVHSIYVCSDLWITANVKTLVTKAHASQIKTMFEFKQIKQFGGGDEYDSNGKSWKPLFETAADYADKILNGAKAGDLAMYTLTKTAK